MRDLELEDDCLYQTQRESGTAVHDVVGSHVLEVDTLLVQEAQRLAHVFRQ